MGSASLNTFERHSECEAQSHACSRGGQLIKGIKRAEPSVFAFAVNAIHQPFLFGLVLESLSPPL
ncbi:hypothetical protein K0M31_010013 [Melipona bicolor]|uniref:Uncharacterized protein n=1 Tax=Melipona bicolor TaxID=60889 RepID=A0AA40FMR5_9HYME|nr:hypothetical protein K0M31_010013 [Melipona bicolor]